MTAATLSAPSRSPSRSLAQHLRVAVHGADTPSGRELASLLRLHPAVESARELACDGSILVGWDGGGEPRWQPDGADLAPDVDVDVVFVAAQAGAIGLIERAREAGARVIDLSGSLPRSGGDREVAYGLPELGSERLAEADQVRSAGSVATCATLALGPAAIAGHLGRRVDVEAIVGHRRAAGEVRPTFVEACEEIQLNVRELHRCTQEPHVAVEPRLDSSADGVYARTRLGEPSADRIQTLYETFYADTPCVEVLAQGLPSLPAVQGTNKAQIGVRQTEDGDVEVACALDGSIKGAVGQAIQNMNLMHGLPETLGLPDAAPAPTERRRARRPDL